MCVIPDSSKRGSTISFIGRGRTQRKIVDTEKRNPFWLEDETGRVLIQPQAATLDIQADAKLRSGIFSEPTPEMVRLLRQFGERSTGSLGVRRKLRYKECFLAPGDQLYVLGTAQTVQNGSTSDTTPAHIIRLGTGKIFLISDKSEKKLLTMTLLKANRTFGIGNLDDRLRALFRYDGNLTILTILLKWMEITNVRT